MNTLSTNKSIAKQRKPTLFTLHSSLFTKNSLKGVFQ